MTKARKKLLLQHLENVSWKVLDEYRDTVGGLIRGKSGIYALYRKDKLYYVGLANNLMRRLNQHLRDRHNGKWDKFSVYLTKDDGHMKELEALILRIVAPTGNKVGGKFAGSKNLRQEFSSRMRDRDSDNRALLLGGKAVQRRQRVKARSGRGTKSLSGSISHRIILKGWNNGWEYKAALLKNGTISYDGEKYDSPSTAATAAIGSRKNGWVFWHYKKGKDWVKLSNLR